MVTEAEKRRFAGVLHGILRVLSAVFLGLSWFNAVGVLAADARASRVGPVVRVSIGGGSARTDVADASNSASGVVLGLQAGTAVRRFQFLGDLTFQPFKVANPRRAESFTTLYALASLQVQTGMGAYARLGIGPAFFRYSGPDVVGTSDTSIAYGATLGYESRRETGIRPGIEALARWSSSSDGELSARVIALQITATWYRSQTTR